MPQFSLADISTPTRSALLGAGPLFAAFSIPFWIAGGKLGKSGIQSIYNSICKQHLEIKRGGGEYLFWKELPFIGKEQKRKPARKECQGKTRDLKLLGIESLDGSDSNRVAAISFMTPEGKVYIGEGLQLAELQEVYVEIESFLQSK